MAAWWNLRVTMMPTFAWFLHLNSAVYVTDKGQVLLSHYVAHRSLSHIGYFSGSLYHSALVCEV